MNRRAQDTNVRALHISASLSALKAVDNPLGGIPLDEIIVEAALRRNLRAGDVTRLLSQ